MIRSVSARLLTSEQKTAKEKYDRKYKIESDLRSKRWKQAKQEYASGEITEAEYAAKMVSWNAGNREAQRELETYYLSLGIYAEVADDEA